MGKIQHGIDATPGTANGGRYSQGLNTLGLGQLFMQIIETMQHRVISKLENDIYVSRNSLVKMNQLAVRLGDPGLPAVLGSKGWKMMLDDPHDSITKAMTPCMSGDARGTMPSTWEAIWQMFPEDMDGILAHMQKNIHSEVIKPCDIQSLEVYLGILIISSAVIPIVWDFDHRTLDFLGDDKIQQSLKRVHQYVNGNDGAMRA